LSQGPGVPELRPEVAPLNFSLVASQATRGISRAISEESIDERH
jgi:hypothetical protein